MLRSRAGETWGGTEEAVIASFVPLGHGTGNTMQRKTMSPRRQSWRRIKSKIQEFIATDSGLSGVEPSKRLEELLGTLPAREQEKARKYLDARARKSGDGITVVPQSDMHS